MNTGGHPMPLASDFRDLFRSIPAAATATAFQVALAPVVGSLPQTVAHSDYYEIVFTPEQEDRLAEWIRSQLNKEPGPVRIASGGVALKVISRQYWPWVLGLATVAAGLGYVAGKKG